MSVVRALAALAGALLAFSIVGLCVVHLVSPQRDGPLALSQILAPHLFLLLVPFLVLALTRGVSGRLLRLGLVAAALTFTIRFVPGWIPLSGSSPAAAAGAHRLGVLTWNLELGQPDPDAVVARLRASDAAVIGLVELTPHHAQAIERDAVLAARYPTMDLRPMDGSLGIGLLSTLPSVEPPRRTGDPPVLVGRLDAGDGSTLAVVVAHPLPGTIDLAAGDLIPVDYDATSRDRHLDQVRAIVEPILHRGEPLLLIGDFNVVDREPGYGELAAGLTDAQRAVGVGPGHTWRPGRLEWLPFGLLRIDYLFSANGVAPVTVGVDCTPRGSDHCIVEGVMALP